MAETGTPIPLEKIDSAINRAIHYLSQHQLPNGEFIAYMAPDEAMQEHCAPDSGNYMTGLIGLCLLPLQHWPVVDNILTKCTNYLSYQMMRGGVWQHQSKSHRWFKYLAPDIDDTTLISSLLKQRKVSFPDNLPLLLYNKTKNGTFYTWFTIHNTFWRYSKTYWRLILRELKHPIINLVFWSRHEHSRNDIDAIANANLIAYLGHSQTTEPAIKYIVELIKQNKEGGSDKWYFNPIVYYYFIARLAFIEITPILDLKDLLVQKINSAIASKKNFLNCPLEIALAVSSLLMLNHNNDDIELYTKKLLQLQKATGEWDRYAFYSAGPRLLAFWGCEELTTALSIEALNLYNNRLKTKQL